MFPLTKANAELAFLQIQSICLLNYLTVDILFHVHEKVSVHTEYNVCIYIGFSFCVTFNTTRLIA